MRFIEIIFDRGVIIFGFVPGARGCEINLRLPIHNKPYLSLYPCALKNASFCVIKFQKTQKPGLTLYEPPETIFSGRPARILHDSLPHPYPCVSAPGARFFKKGALCDNLILAISPIILIFSKAQSTRRFAPLSFFYPLPLCLRPRIPSYFILKFPSSSITKKHRAAFLFTTISILRITACFKEIFVGEFISGISVVLSRGIHRPECRPFSGKGPRASRRFCLIRDSRLFFKSPFNIFARQRMICPDCRASSHLFVVSLFIVKSAPAAGRDRMPFLYQCPFLPGFRTNYLQSSIRERGDWKPNHPTWGAQSQPVNAAASVPVKFLEEVRLSGRPGSRSIDCFSADVGKIPGGRLSLSCFIYPGHEIFLKIHDRKGPGQLAIRTSLRGFVVSSIIARTFAAFLLMTAASHTGRSPK
jgi:hypothetical protein